MTEIGRLTICKLSIKNDFNAFRYVGLGKNIYLAKNLVEIQLKVAT